MAGGSILGRSFSFHLVNIARCAISGRSGVAMHSSPGSLRTVAHPRRRRRRVSDWDWLVFRFVLTKGPFMCILFFPALSSHTLRYSAIARSLISVNAVIGA